MGSGDVAHIWYIRRPQVGSKLMVHSLSACSGAAAKGDMSNSCAQQRHDTALELPTVPVSARHGGRRCSDGSAIAV